MKPDFKTISIFTALQDQQAKKNILIDQSAGVLPFTRSAKATGNLLSAWQSHIPSNMEHRVDVKVGDANDVFNHADAGKENTVFVIQMGENFIQNVAYLRAFRTAFALRFEKAPNLAVSVEDEQEFRALFKLMAAILGEANILLSSDALMDRYFEEEAQLHSAIDALGGAHDLEVATENFIQQLLA